MYRNPWVSFTFGWFPFPISSLCCFLYSSLWGNKKWEPQYKGKESGNFLEQNHLSSLCKWSSLNTPSTEIPCVSFIFGWLPSIKVKNVEIVCNKVSLAGCKWSSLNAPGTETPVSHPLFGESLFLIFSPCCFLPSSHWGNKKWKPPVKMSRKWKILGTKSA